MPQFDMDRVTAQAFAEFERTDVGLTFVSWMDALIEERKERLCGHRGIHSIPEMWHDQGFVDGVRAVAHIFGHAKNMVPDWDPEMERTEVAIPQPTYLGATPEDPRR